MTSKVSFKQFKTRDLVASRPTVKIPIYILGVGALENQYLEIVSQYDDKYRQAQAQFWVDCAEMSFGDLKDKEKDELQLKLRAKQMASLVVGWTFEEECTLENATEFLYQNPNMFDAVNVSAAKDEDFFGLRLEGSQKESDS